jgi:uncharacterized RDD family membrane protein YckC/predicted nucleic acid-binding Zn ribbon protein
LQLLTCCAGKLYIEAKCEHMEKVVFKVHCSKCGEKLPDDAKFCTNCGNPVTTDAAQTKSETVIERFEHDTLLQELWIRRLIAYVIDSIIVGIGTFLVLAIAMFPIFIANPSTVFNLLSFPFAMGIVFLLYFPIGEALFGGTFGKNFLGLKVVVKSGGRLSLEKAFIRNISKIHPVLLVLDVVGGLITSNDLHQKYSDRIVNTTVAIDKTSSSWNL